MRMIAILSVCWMGSAAIEPLRAEAPRPPTTRAATTAPAADAQHYAPVLGPEYPEYTPSPGQLKGTLVSVGSPFVSSLINRWADVLDNSNSELIVNVSGFDSEQGPPALTAGTAQLAAMIRRISDKE